MSATFVPGITQLMRLTTYSFWGNPYAHMSWHQNYPKCIEESAIIFLSLKRSEKNIWIIIFRAQTKKTIFRGADLAETGLAQFPKPVRSDFMIFQLPHMEECTAPLHFSRQADQKIYFNCLIWTPDKLITIFWRFTALDLRNRPGRFWKQAMWAMSIDGVLGSWVCDF